MTRREAIKKARTLTSSIAADRLRLGRILCLICDKSWFKPYSGIIEWADVELGLPHRTCCALTRIARVADDLAIPDRVVAEVGWTKFHLVSAIMTADNWRELIDIAKAHSSQELKHMLAGRQAPGFAKTFQGLDSPSLNTVDEALGQAKAVLGVGTESEALAAICETFLRAI